MNVVSTEQVMIAQGAGACAVMTLERVPADIQLRGDDLIRGIDKSLRWVYKRAITEVIFMK